MRDQAGGQRLSAITDDTPDSLVTIADRYLPVVLQLFSCQNLDSAKSHNLVGDSALEREQCYLDDVNRAQHPLARFTSCPS